MLIYCLLVINEIKPVHLNSNPMTPSLKYTVMLTNGARLVQLNPEVEIH